MDLSGLAESGLRSYLTAMPDIDLKPREYRPKSKLREPFLAKGGIVNLLTVITTIVFLYWLSRGLYWVLHAVGG